jgi:hypothetical protein
MRIDCEGRDGEVTGTVMRECDGAPAWRRRLRSEDYFVLVVTAAEKSNSLLTVRAKFGCLNNGYGVILFNISRASLDNLEIDVPQ